MILGLSVWRLQTWLCPSSFFAEPCHEQACRTGMLLKLFIFFYKYGGKFLADFPSVFVTHSFEENPYLEYRSNH
jgi:hypothetical protein